MKKTILSWLLIGSSCALFAQNTNGDTTVRNNTSTNTYNTNTMNGTNTNTNGDTGNGTMYNNGNYNAYNNTSVALPSNVQMYFVRDYPAATNVNWQQNGDWYHGTYLTNGRYSHVYYNQAGKTYTVSLPVTQTYVPDDIINRATTMYGPAIYDVTTMKATDGTPVYQVRLIENGTMRSQYITDNGSTVMSPFRVDTDTQMSTGSYSGMDNGNTTTTTTTTDMSTTEMSNTNTQSSVEKVKIKSKDGKTKIKTKSADGTTEKTKIKDGEIKHD